VPDGFIREKMWVTRPAGTHLSESQKKPGEYSPLTRDDATNELGQVTLDPIDEDEADSWASPPPVWDHGTTAPASAQRPVSGRVVRVGVQIGRIWGAGGGRRLGMADPVAFQVGVAGRLALRLPR
jgi:hypothetical protein